MNKPKELNMMNKMKVMVMAVLMVISCAFNLSAKDIKINESKLTSISYVRKVCNITGFVKNDKCTAYELDNDKGLFLVLKNGSKGTLIVKDGVLYGRRVYRLDDGTTVSCNLHGTKCIVKGPLKKFLNDEDIEEFTVKMKDNMINGAKESGFIK